MVAGVNLSYNSSASAMQMAQSIFGDGVNVVGASYTGSWYSSAIYSGGDTISPFATPGDTGVILSTGVASWFTNGGGNANQSGSRSYDTGGPNNDADFNAIAGTNTYDASFMVVDFIPDHDVMTMQFVFSSDEYPEYSNSVFNDVVGVWINGTHVPLSVAGGPAAVGTVNQTDNVNLFVSNTGSQYNTEMDGFTVTMTLTIPVNAGQVNSIKLGIADVTDAQYDSNLLIAGGSLQTTLVAQDDAVTMQQGTTKIVDVLGNDINNTGGTLTITHINGIAVSAGDSVTLTTGQTVTLNPDATFSVTTDTDIETISFTYQVGAVDGSGSLLQSDVGFVTVDTIPCFVAGTLIETAEGARPVELLAPGDLVLTRDDGLQPLRWSGRRRVAARGNLAPIRIKAGTFGPHRTLMVSPQHRVLVRDTLAELLFGEPEVLVNARDLVNDRSVQRVEGGEVDYVHILFDRHQVVWSEGLATESFLPGPEGLGSLEDEMIEEIRQIFPELDPASGTGYGPAIRPILKRHEAQALLRRVA